MTCRIGSGNNSAQKPLPLSHHTSDSSGQLLIESPLSMSRFQDRIKNGAHDPNPEHCFSALDNSQNKVKPELVVPSTYFNCRPHARVHSLLTSTQPTGHNDSPEEVTSQSRFVVRIDVLSVATLPLPPSGRRNAMPTLAELELPA